MVHCETCHRCEEKFRTVEQLLSVVGDRGLGAVIDEMIEAVGAVSVEFDDGVSEVSSSVIRDFDDAYRRFQSLVEKAVKATQCGSESNHPEHEPCEEHKS